MPVPYSPAKLVNPHSDAPMTMAASSPLASWSDHGMPARPQYSSVRRGSNIRRKFTFPDDPPVPTITALSGAKVAFDVVVVDGDADYAPGSRCLAMNGRHPMLEQDFYAGLKSGGIERLHQAAAGRRRCLDTRIHRLAGLDQGPIHRCAVERSRSRHSDLVTAQIVRRPINDLHAMREQKIERRHAVVRKRAGDLVVVVPVRRSAIGFDHRPVDQIPEQQVR